METLRTALETAEAERVAIAHFNVSDYLLGKLWYLQCRRLENRS